MNGQKDGITLSNLAMMVMHLPVKFEFDWTKHFPVRVQKQKCGQTDGQKNGQKTDKRTGKCTNKQTELH